MINITDAAKERIQDLLIEENRPNTFIRAFVQGGGCAGFSYGFTFDDVKNEDDFDFAIGNYFLIIDAMSMQYLEGSTIDYKIELMGSNFVINNPNVSSQCGCGSSFSV
jgi:iron-sulfur cluster insertion protein